MRAFRSSQYRKPCQVNPITELTDDRALRIPLYAARARKEKPLFEGGVVLVKETPEPAAHIQVRHGEMLNEEDDLH